MLKKLNSLEALSNIQFKNLVLDPELISENEQSFAKQNLEAHFSNKGRGGKTVTLIKGFKGSAQELKELSKTLKQSIGVGGTVKNGEIIIQGNYRDQLMKIINQMGHNVKRIGG
jgi:translation initiation factor 1